MIFVAAPYTSPYTPWVRYRCGDGGPKYSDRIAFVKWVRRAELLEQDDESLLQRTVKTLARIGDGRALLPLARRRQRVTRSALRAESEES